MYHCPTSVVKLYYITKEGADIFLFISVFDRVNLDLLTTVSCFSQQTGELSNGQAAEQENSAVHRVAL